MATQHPDNAGSSPFTGKCFVSTQDEIDECYKVFSELGVHEYMWDWEGKFVDEAVIDRLYQNYTRYFQENQIGKDVFLTFRVPNIWEDVSHRLPRSFMNILSAENAAKTYKFHAPPIFEIILPMTTAADQLLYLQEKFINIAKATGDIFEMKSDMSHIEVIPLIETFETMFNTKKLLEEYVAGLKKNNYHISDYIRLFLARSDPAMNLGLIPAMICCKIAISQGHEFMKETGIKVYPWIGGGSLPFRGSVNPDNTENVIREYKGIYSLTIQSAFRSDYDMNDVKRSIGEFNIRIPKNWEKAVYFTREETKVLEDFILEVKVFFQSFVEAEASLINRVASHVPKRRERVQHVGLFGYSRGIGEVKLPRAITFTGALYSLGIPPEFIGTGRLLNEAKKKGILPLIEKTYVHLREDLLHAGHYLNRENLTLLCQEDSTWEAIREDLKYVEEYLGETVGPKKVHHMIHRNFTSNIFYKMSLNLDFTEDLLKAAEIRKSIG